MALIETKWKMGQGAVWKAESGSVTVEDAIEWLKMFPRDLKLYVHDSCEQGIGLTEGSVTSSRGVLLID